MVGPSRTIALALCLGRLCLTYPSLTLITLFSLSFASLYLETASDPQASPEAVEAASTAASALLATYRARKGSSGGAWSWLASAHAYGNLSRSDLAASAYQMALRDPALTPVFKGVCYDRIAAAHSKEGRLQAALG